MSPGPSSPGSEDGIAPDHDSHGSTPAAWTAVVIVTVAFTLGTLAIILGIWPLFWISVRDGPSAPPPQAAKTTRRDRTIAVFFKRVLLEMDPGREASGEAKSETSGSNIRLRTEDASGPATRVSAVANTTAKAYPAIVKIL